jgi:hypothetical protein
MNVDVTPVKKTNRALHHRQCSVVFPLGQREASYFAAGGGAGWAGGASGVAGGVAGGSGGAGAGAGASVLAGSAGFCSSAFLQPITANDNVTKKSTERIIENTFFIQFHLLSIDLHYAG